MIAQITKISYFLLPLLFILGVYCYTSFQKLKKAEAIKLQLLYIELDSEKVLSEKLKLTSKKVKKRDSTLYQKLLKIKIGIFNVDFTLSELL